MGSLQQGRSSWRILRDEETAFCGGSSRRKLYGCVVTLLDGQTDAPVGISKSFGGRNEEVGAEQMLLSWSQVSVPPFKLLECNLSLSCIKFFRDPSGTLSDDNCI